MLPVGPLSVNSYTTECEDTLGRKARLTVRKPEADSSSKKSSKGRKGRGGKSRRLNEEEEFAGEVETWDRHTTNRALRKNKKKKSVKLEDLMCAL